MSYQEEVLKGLNGIKEGVEDNSLEELIEGLIGEVDNDPTENTLLARLKSLEDKIDAITDEGKVVAHLSSSDETLESIVVDEDGNKLKVTSSGKMPVDFSVAQLETYLGKIVTATGEKTDTAVTDVTLTASEIALLKGILKQLQGNGDGSLPVSMVGGTVTIDGDTELVGSVELIDGTDSTKKAKITEDGSLSVQLSGSIVADETDKAVTANADILADITATKTEMTTLMLATDTGGILKLEVDGSLNSLNGGVALDAGKWYAFDIPILAASVYNLQFSVIATMQIKWIGGF